MNFSKASIKQQNLARITNMQFTWFKTRKKILDLWEQLTFFHKYIQNFSGDSTLKVLDEKQKILVAPEHFFHSLNQVYWICLWIQRGCLKGNSIGLAGLTYGYAPVKWGGALGLKGETVAQTVSNGVAWAGFWLKWNWIWLTLTTDVIVYKLHWELFLMKQFHVLQLIILSTSSIIEQWF